jgi:calcium-dependent protein kinase
MVFTSLDTNSDGKLSKDEILEGFKKTMGEGLAEEEMDKFFKAADTDGSGEIDYSEWIAATINKKRVLTNEKLEYAFNLFDKNGNGSIDTQEVKTVLGVGRNIDESIWNAIV